MNAAVSAATTATAALSGQLAAVNATVSSLQAVAGSQVGAVAAVNASFSNRLDSFSGQVTALNTTVSSVAVAFNALPAPIRDGSLVATVAAVNASVQIVAGSLVVVGTTVVAVNASLSGRVDNLGAAVSGLPQAVRDGSVVTASLKAWVSFNGTGGSGPISPLSSFNVVRVTRTSLGHLSVELSVDLANPVVTGSGFYGVNSSNAFHHNLVRKNGKFEQRDRHNWLLRHLGRTPLRRLRLCESYVGVKTAGHGPMQLERVKV